MNEQAVIKQLLTDHWEPDVAGRDTSVPEPNMVIAGDEKRKRLETGDQLYIKEGGLTEKQAASLGWTEQRVTDQVTIDVRTIEGRERLDGGIDPATYESEEYGGLIGEIERIIDLHRKGVGDYHLVEMYEVSPLSENMGFGRWRSDVEIRLHTGPINVDPPSP